MGNQSKINSVVRSFKDGIQPALNLLVANSTRDAASHIGYDIYEKLEISTVKRCQFVRAKVVKVDCYPRDISIESSYQYIKELMSRIKAETSEQTDFDFRVFYVLQSEKYIDLPPFSSFNIETQIQMSCDRRTTSETLTSPEFKELFNNAIKKVLE